MQLRPTERPQDVVGSRVSNLAHALGLTDRPQDVVSHSAGKCAKRGTLMLKLIDRPQDVVG